MRQYLIIFFLSVSVFSFGQNFSKDRFKPVLAKADSIIKSYYGGEIINKYTLLDSANSFYMNNEGLNWNESCSFTESLTFQPNYFFINYLFFYPGFHGDTIDISIMIDENGAFSTQYAITSSLIKISNSSQLNIIERQIAKDIISKKGKFGDCHYNLKLTWNNEIKHLEFNQNISLEKEKLIWFGKCSDLKKNKTYFIAIDAVSGKTLWKKAEKS